MRLSQQQADTIKTEVATVISKTAKIVLFGSRVNDDARGGDIDLLLQVENKDDNLYKKSLILSANLQQKLGEQKIDIVTCYKGQSLQNIHKEALRTGLVL